MDILAKILAFLLIVFVLGSPVLWFYTVYSPNMYNRFLENKKWRSKYFIPLIIFIGTTAFFTRGIDFFLRIFPSSTQESTFKSLGDSLSLSSSLGVIYAFGYLFIINELENYYVYKRENEFEKKLLKREKEIENADKNERQRILIRDDAFYKAYSKRSNYFEPNGSKTWSRYMSYDEFIDFRIIHSLRNYSDIYRNDHEDNKTRNQA